MISVKLIMGVFKRVERIVYPSTGSVVERIMPMNSNVPEEVVVIQHPKKPHTDHIVNMEYEQYALHHQNTVGL